jgi:hypothetical protein
MSVPIWLYMCEVDPKGKYEVRHYGDRWVVRRCGVRIGELPSWLVEADGPLATAQMLVGYGVFVSKKLYDLGPRVWASDVFPSLVDREVSSL